MAKQSFRINVTKCTPRKRHPRRVLVWNVTCYVNTSTNCSSFSNSQRLPPLSPEFDSYTRRLMWVEFVVGSLPAPRVFLRVFCCTSLHKNQHFQIAIRFGRSKSITTSVLQQVKSHLMDIMLLREIRYYNFSAMLIDEFRDCNTGIHIRYKCYGKLFNPRRIKAIRPFRRRLSPEYQ